MKPWTAGTLVALGVTVAGVAPGQAHPHVWVDSRSQIVFDGTGALTGVRHSWTFDELFSAYAVQGLDTDGDGIYSREELQPLAEVNVESLSDFEFFTFLELGGLDGQFVDPVDYWLEYDGVRLTLHFTLPLSEPLIVDGQSMSIEVFDPTFFVDFRLADTETASLEGGVPAACQLDVERAEEFDAYTAMRLAEIPPEVRDLPPELFAMTADNANVIRVEC